MDRGCVAATPMSECEGDVQAHHVITQQQLRKLGLDVLLWDPANGAAVCERHHRRHHNRREPIAKLSLPKRCRDFCVRHGLTDVLDRYYWSG